MPVSGFRRAGVLAAVGLLVSSVGVVASAVPAQARPATGGVGRFGTAINWMEWGADGANLPNAGFTGTSTQTIGGVQVTLTCTTSNLSSSQGASGTFLKAYRSGTWTGDALDDLYNIGGDGLANQLVYGLEDAVGGKTVSFDISCSAMAASGHSVPLAGLVFGDAEQSGASEYVAATPIDPGTWRIIDRYRTAGCINSTIATRTGSTNRLVLAADTGALNPCAVGPAAVAYLEGSTRMRAELRGGGFSAIAIGAVLAADFGDGPASYGDAAHVASLSFSEGDLPADTPTRVSDTGFKLALAAAPPIRLGDYTDPEGVGYYSADATGDDVNGSAAFPPADDEEGLLSTTAISGVIGQPYQATVACYPAGAPLAGWIDWNVDGDFNDVGERSVDGTCAGASTLLTWASVPDSVIGRLRGVPSLLRLRVAADASEIVNPSGTAASGEAEDYQVTVSVAPAITVTKVLDRGRALAADQFTVQISQGASTVASATSSGAESSVSTGAVMVSSGEAYTVSESLAAGSSASLADYDTALVCTNTTSGLPVVATGSAPSWTLPPMAEADGFSCTITNTAHIPALTLTKAASAVIDADDNGPDVGDTVNYSFAVANTGNVVMSGLSITETAFSGTLAGLSTVVCQATTLAVGESTTCTATYTLTQADVNAGSVTNTAQAVATPAGTLPQYSSPTANASVSIARAASLTLVKSVTPTDQSLFVAGNVLSYSFVVQNTGNVTLDPVSVTESDFTGNGTDPAIDCGTAAPLAPGGQLVCTAEYTIVQDDVDQNGVTNEARATGTPPAGVTAPTPQLSSTHSPANPSPGLELVKSVDPVTATTVGATVNWRFALKNTGNVSLNDVHPVEGAFSGTDALGTISCPTQGTALLPGATAYCSAAYTVTQDDLDAGKVTNNATGAATAPGNTPVTAASSRAELALTGAPQLTLAKSVSPTTATAAGDHVVYSYAIRNTGNIKVTNVGVNEHEFTGTGALGALVCGKSALAPSETTTCTAGYDITQADVDAGRVENTAVATASLSYGTDTVTSGEDSALVTITRQAGFTFVKSASPTDPVALVVGQAVQYKFVLTNTGNVSLANPSVAEASFNGHGVPLILDCPDPTPIAPGAKRTCTAPYTVAQADIDAGRLSNTARSSVGVPTGMTGLTPLTDTVNLDLLATTGLKLVKTVSPVKAAVVGDQVVWSFELTNTGKATLHDVRPVEESFTGTGRLGDIVCPGGGAALLPTLSLTCTAAYAVTQADLDAGKVTNTASGTALDPSNAAVTSPADAAVLSLTRTSGIKLTKSADPATGNAAGQHIKYSFLIENTGNTTLTEVALAEGEFTGTGKLGAISCPDGTTLLPRASKTCTADYVLTQADVDGGNVRNDATVTGKAPGGAAVTSQATVRVWLDRHPGLKLTKTADRPLDTVGETVTYSFELVNTGNVTLTGVKINEGEFTGTGKLSPITCPTGADTLTPGQTVVCTATYVLTKDDVSSGRMRNTASAIADSPTGRIASVLAVSEIKPSTLPFTGGEAGLAAVAAVLTLAGAGAWMVARRRRVV